MFIEYAGVEERHIDEFSIGQKPNGVFVQFLRYFIQKGAKQNRMHHF